MSTTSGIPAAWAISANAAGIGETLDKHAARVIGDRAPDLVHIVGVDKGDVPAEFLDRMGQLVERATIEFLRRDNMRAGVHQHMEYDDLRRMARRHRQRRHATLHRRNLAFQRAVGRVHDAGINIPERIEIEQIGGMFDIIENIRRRLVNRRDPRVGRRIRFGAGVDGHGFQMGGFEMIGHDASLFKEVSSVPNINAPSPQPSL